MMVGEGGGGLKGFVKITWEWEGYRRRSARVLEALSVEAEALPRIGLSWYSCQVSDVRVSCLLAGV